MSRVEIKEDFCKACELCIPVCKKAVLHIGQSRNAMGYSVVCADGEKECMGCRMCAVMCPEGAITIKK